MYRSALRAVLYGFSDGFGSIPKAVWISLAATVILVGVSKIKAKIRERS